MAKIEFKGKFLAIEQRKRHILIIGDLHLGFESALNNAGAFINRYIFDEMKRSIEEVLETRKKFDEVVLLGDIKHTFGSILREEREQFKKIIEILEKKCSKIVVLKGNHDPLLDYLARDSKIEVLDKHTIGDITLAHGDRELGLIKDEKTKIVIIGHLHPAITLRDGAKAEKYKCFLDGKYKGKRFIIVPSLISNTEGTDPRDFKPKMPWNLPIEKFEVIAVGNGLENYNFGILKKIKTD